MVFVDHTLDFRDLIDDKKVAYPPSRSKSPFGGRSPTRKGKGKEVEQSEEFLKEAYRIYHHLESLSTLLRTIRKPYLSISAPPPSSRRPRPPTSNGESSNQDGEEDLRRWEGSKFLSDRERDEIDIRGKMILRRCRDRVAALEDGERARQKTIVPTSTSAIYSFLPSLAPSSSTSDVSQHLVTAHRASVTWTLNDLLAKLSAALANLQEERAKRREERSRTLGGQAAKEAAMLQTRQAREKSRTGPSSNGIHPNGDALPPQLKGSIPTDEPPIESQLSAEQLQLFSTENNTLLEHMESQLDSVLAAEKSLLEISALQTELVRHLVQQTEITDRLYDEAVGSVGDMGKANEQLKQARKRGKEGRLFLLIFLLGASLALLFLDWYS